MWFKAKTKNKRHQRRRVLDVKLRSDHVRALRTRGLAVVLGVVFGTVFCLYVLWRSGEWMLDRLVYENSAFAIQQVEITTDGVIKLDQLSRWSAVERGENLLALDLARVKRDLELVPNILTVSVERLLPHTLRIRVLERTAVARVILPRIDPERGLVLQTWLLDANGAVMIPLASSHRQVPSNESLSRLPELTGVAPTDLRLGACVDSARVLAGLDFLQDFNHSGLADKVRLQSVNVSETGVLHARTTGQALVTLRTSAFEPQLRRWQLIHQRALELNKSILSLDLAVKNNVPVRWVNAPPRAVRRVGGNNV